MSLMWIFSLGCSTDDAPLKPRRCRLRLKYSFASLLHAHIYNDVEKD